MKLFMIERDDFSIIQLEAEPKKRLHQSSAKIYSTASLLLTRI